MWAPKSLNTKSNSHGSSCFVFHKVSHLKHIPLKACFTKLGSYTMKKLKKRREKSQHISLLFLSHLLIALWKCLFPGWQNWINLQSTFISLQTHHFFFETTVARRPTDGGDIFSTKSNDAAFSQNGIGAALRGSPQSFWKLTPSPPSQILPQSQSVSFDMCVYLPLTKCKAEK